MSEQEMPKHIDVLSPEEQESLIRQVVSFTKAEDWMDYDTRPYLLGSGCQRIEAAYGIQYESLPPIEPEKTGEKDDNGDEVIIYQFRARFTVETRRGTRSIEETGRASTDEKSILSQRREKKGRNGTYRSMSLGEARSRAMDLANARCRHRGITGVLGIRAISFNDLQDYAGISQDDIVKRGDNNRLNNNRGQQGGPQQQYGQQAPPQQNARQQAPADPPATQKQAEDLGKYAAALREALGPEAGTEAFNAVRGPLKLSTWHGITQPNAAKALDALAKLFQDKQIDDPVTGEVNAPPAGGASGADDIPASGAA